MWHHEKVTSKTCYGQFTEFDVPGADPVVGCTCPDGINDLGVVAGFYVDTNSVFHGFLRTPGGNITGFDDSEAGTGANQGTIPVSINDLGVVAGFYIDGNSVFHGFVRTPDGRTSGQQFGRHVCMLPEDDSASAVD